MARLGSLMASYVWLWLNLKSHFEAKRGQNREVGVIEVNQLVGASLRKAMNLGFHVELP